MADFTYGSVCSGIEAATVGWHPLGWKPAFFSEIEAAPSAVLAHHYPEIPNLGDFTQITREQCGAIDLLVGGTPCQDFSIAGLRAGLDGDRGNLSLEFVKLAARAWARWLAWENVPGVLSSNKGRDFAAILGALSGLCVEPPENGWRNSGCIGGGPGYGLAWRVLDAQYIRIQPGFPFAVPQRRRRVFVIGYLGDWRRAAAVLFERESVCGNPPPRRQSGQGIAPTLSARTKGGGGLGTDFDLDGGLVESAVEVCRNVVGTLTRGIGERGADDPERGTLVTVSPTLRAGGNKTGGDRPPGTDVDTADSLIPVQVAHALRADGFDASEDGTGRGTPIIPIDMRQASRGGTLTNNRKEGTTGGAPGVGVGEPGDPAFTVSERGQAIAFMPYRAMATDGVCDQGFAERDVCDAIHGSTGSGSNKSPVLAFDSKASGRNGFGVGEISPTLRSMGHLKTHQNAGGQVAVCFQPRIGRNGRGYEEDIAPALNGADAGDTSDMRPCVAFQERGRDGGRNLEYQEELAYSLNAPNGGGRRNEFNVATAWAVRRLTPIECERLQGFPDGYTLVPYRGREMADGPRYKMLGNAMATNCMRWLGRRIQMVNERYGP